jgi:truncated hemoglobin YjbI
MNPEQTAAQRRDEIANAMRRLAAKHPNKGIEYFHVVSVLQCIADDVSDAEFRAEVRAALAALELVQREVGG